MRSRSASSTADASPSRPTLEVGRFAPSPTGPLHLGSLLTAVGSYLHARAAGGRWLVRMEDLDTVRCVPAETDSILRTLERHGLEWDALSFQHERIDLYHAALDRLAALGETFACTCSRSQLQESSVYPGTCRTHPAGAIDEPHAIRVRAPGASFGFEDGIQGAFSQRLDRDVGDFVVYRRDGVVAYQLAVVVDDAVQHVTQVVRGADLLDNTPRQLLLYRLFGISAPRFFHLPTLVDRTGRKLSKRSAATAVEGRPAPDNLLCVLDLLGQHPIADLYGADSKTILSWAIDHWAVEQVPRGITHPGFVCV